MQQIIINIMNQYGYLGITFLIAIENIFPPIPSEVILTFGGFMTRYTTMKFIPVTIFATLGSILGALVLYYVGYLLPKEKIYQLFDGKLGNLLKIKKDDILKCETWFNQKGILTVFICRFIPTIRSLISIPAGLSHMPLKPFIIFTILGSFIWNIVLIYLGVVAGDNWPHIVQLFNQYAKLIMVILAILIIIVIVIFFRLRKKKEQHV